MEQKPWEVDKRWPDPNFRKNLANHPAELFLGFAGMFVAWSRDGTRILGADADQNALYDKMRQTGLDPVEYVIDYVDRPGGGFSRRWPVEH